MRKYYPVYGWSATGNFFLWPLKMVFRWLSLMKGKSWDLPKPNFEENPVNFSWKDALYLGMKYYGRPHENVDLISPERQLKERDAETADLTIHAGGDLMPYEVMLNDKSDGLWSLCGDHFFGSDITMANLETPMDFSKKSSYVPELMLNDMLFNGSRELWNIFTASERYTYDYVSLANNHMLDSGVDSLKNTLHMLEAKGISYSGAKSNAELPNFVILEKKGYKIGIVNYTYSLNRIVPDNDSKDLICHLRLNDPKTDLAPLAKALREARAAGSDIVIASLHMGNAYQCYPSQHIRDRIREIFEQGSPDIILVHHPHNLQPSEVVHFKDQLHGIDKRGLVYYSLGDFVAYDIFSWSHLTGYATLKIGRSKTGHIQITSGFQFLYLLRDSQGKFIFVPWEMALSEKKYQDEHFYFLKDWYDRHARNFFVNQTLMVD